MPEIVFGLVLTFIVFSLAFYGLIKLLSGTTSKKLSSGEMDAADSRKENRDKAQRFLEDDVQGTSHLLNFLLIEKKIPRSEYERLRGFLDQEYGDRWQLADHLPADVKSDQPATVSETTSKELDAQSTPASVAATTAEAPSDAIVVASLVAEPTSESSGARERTLKSPAPWEIPDPPPQAPRRSFGEIMSGFMLEKNIRWGELASGILIVGSAVGLVVSLREELRDTIPYFSSMMFLLITAAIHTAGIYTLKKWKLRKTSRGTLLIGLLLIPLNIVAACILSGGEDRRALSDPLLWLAITVGLSSFTAMTWLSSKCLFRKGQLPLVFSIMGCCAATLAINRLVEIDGSNLNKLFWTLPLGLSFLAGTVMFWGRKFPRLQWSDKSVERLFVFLGLSSFAALAAGSMIVIRTTSKPAAIVALMPLISTICLVTTLMGRIVWRRAGGKSRRAHRLTGLSLHILGLGLLVLSLVYSASNPSVLLVNSALMSAGLILIARHQSEPRLLFAAWFGLAVFVFALVNLWAGNLNWNDWAGIAELGGAALSGQTGLALLSTGVSVVGVHSLLAKRFADNPWFIKTGLISGAVILLVGCGLTLIASFLNPENQFDVMTATSLLGIAASCGLAGCVYLSSSASLVAEASRQKLLRWLPVGVAGMLFLFLFHCLIWNQWSAQWADKAAFAIGSNWVLLFATHGFVLALVALVGTWFSGTGFLPLGIDDDRQDLKPKSLVPELMGRCSHLSQFLGLLGAFFFVQYQTGLSTGIAVTMAIGLLMLVFVQANYQRDFRVRVDWFTFSTAAAVVVFVAELLTRFEFCPGPGSLRFWLIQGIAVSLWAIVTQLVVWVLEKRSSLKPWVAFDWRVESWVIHAVVLAAVGLIGSALIGGSASELFKDAGHAWVSLGGDRNWGFAFLLAVFSGLLISALRRPLEVTGGAIVLVWFLAWGIGADFFTDTHATGTALRWLLPIGGAIGAVLVACRKPLVPAWVLARNRLGFDGRSTWPLATTQTLINFALGLVALVVLSVSTIAITQVMLNGGVSALGGPDKATMFGDMKKDVSYGIPIAIIVGTFLLYAISERRKWLATAGSLVFQYCVLLSVVLLFVSPHPKLATSWFVNILQAVSVGMTGFGFVWLWFRDRIERNDIESIGKGDETAAVANFAAPGFKWLPQIEIHTLINGLLITALGVLVLLRFYTHPALPGGWINSVGGWLGVFAWAIFGCLAFCVWKRQLTQAHRMSTWMWLVCWLGLVLVGMVAALVDRRMLNAGVAIPWRTFNVILSGVVLVCLSQTVLLWFERGPAVVRKIFSGTTSRSFKSIRGDQSVPLLFSGAILLVFAVRGISFNQTDFWFYFATVFALAAFITFAGICRQSPWLAFISAGVTSLMASALVTVDPQGWFASSQPHFFNVLSVSLVVLATIWSGFYVWYSVGKQQQVRPTMTMMSNVVLLGSSVWALCLGLRHFALETAGLSALVSSGWGLVALLCPLILGALHLWNNRRRGWVVSLSIWLIGATILCVSCLVEAETLRIASVFFGLGAVVALCGLVWSSRGRWFRLARQGHAPQLIQIERSMNWQFPALGLFLGALILLGGFLSSVFLDLRVERYLFAISPLGIAIGMGCFSDRSKRRWMQLVSLSVLTLGAIYISWADLLPDDPMGSTRIAVRVLLVLAAAMFVYGWVVSRWVRPGDGWLQSLREMSVGTCLVALVAFVIVLLEETRLFVPDVGCGMMLPQAATIAFVVLGMVAGLIAIAVLPKRDPFSLSLTGRMGYVYAAQLALAMLAVHLYMTMPFLFQIGIKDYWPYIAMLLCFGGVGVAQVLENRKLTVLAQPLLTTAVLLPVLVALMIWGIDSKADAALVMLFAGLAYLMVSYTQSSALAGMAAIVFGNLSLWLFYGKFDGFSIMEHPQLWLIPPAISTLVAAQISRNSLTKKQLGLIRYICLSVIYLSSTSEIFINGLGEKLWPPVILAVLAVGGVLIGMMLQIRAFLYLGIVFLFLALVTMVSHAHQRFEHVWPWWAFGFSLGVAILVMFGLFEKKKKEMGEALGQLRQWDL